MGFRKMGTPNPPTVVIDPAKEPKPTTKQGTEPVQPDSQKHRKQPTK